MSFRMAISSISDTAVERGSANPGRAPWRFTGGMASFLLVLTASTRAGAEDAVLHHAQSGALLEYADMETQILYATLSAKEFDVELAHSMLKELARTLNDAKRGVDRTRLLVSDEKLEPELTKVLESVKRAENQLRDLTTDVEEQTGEKEPAHDDHRDELGEAEEPPKRDWALLKNGTAWLYSDLKEARALHASAGKKLKGAPLKPPPKPSGKREE